MRGEKERLTVPSSGKEERCVATRKERLKFLFSIHFVGPLRFASCDGVSDVDKLNMLRIRQQQDIRIVQMEL